MLQVQSEQKIGKNYTELALRHAKYREIKEITFSQLIEQIATMCLTSLIANLTPYLISPTSNQMNFIKNIKHKVVNLPSIRRPVQHTMNVFSFKIVLDYFNQKRLIPYDQYKVGAAVGLLSYIFGRPIDQIDYARRQIFRNENKHISRLEAYKVVLRHDGFKGLYKHENLLGPFCNSIYRSVYFGLWARLLDQYGKKNQLVDYLAIPFAASLGASISTAIPDKLRSYCFEINDAKSKTIQKRNKNLLVEIPSTFKLMFEHLSSPNFRFTKNDLKIISMAVIRNWIMLGTFTFGQDQLQKYHKAQNKQTKE